MSASAVLPHNLPKKRMVGEKNYPSGVKTT